eukprot:g6184.t1
MLYHSRLQTRINKGGGKKAKNKHFCFEDVLFDINISQVKEKFMNISVHVKMINYVNMIMNLDKITIEIDSENVAAITIVW